MIWGERLVHLPDRTGVKSWHQKARRGFRGSTGESYQMGMGMNAAVTHSNKSREELWDHLTALN